MASWQHHDEDFCRYRWCSLEAELNDLQLPMRFGLNVNILYECNLALPSIRICKGWFISSGIQHYIKLILIKTCCYLFLRMGLNLQLNLKHCFVIRTMSLMRCVNYITTSYFNCKFVKLMITANFFLCKGFWVVQHLMSQHWALIQKMKINKSNKTWWYWTMLFYLGIILKP